MSIPAHLSGPKLIVVREPEELEPEWFDIFEKQGCRFKDGILAQCGFGEPLILLANSDEEYFVFVVDIFVFMGRQAHEGGAMYQGNSGHEATRVFLDQVRIHDAK